MKHKTIISALVFGASLSAGVMPAHAALMYKQCEVLTTREPVIIIDKGSSFSVYTPDLQPVYASPDLKQDPKSKTYIATREGMKFSRNSNNVYTVTDNLLQQSFVIGLCKNIGDTTPPENNDAIASGNEDTYQDQAGHGSEYVERGDIARPEYKGANKFTGDLYDAKGDFIQKVTLIRAANDDITLVFSDTDKKVYKKDSNMAGKPGTYGEPRLATEFYVAEGRTYDVTHTAIVK